MLNISPINFTKITNNFAKASQPIKPALTQDVFVRSTNNVSFKGNEVKPEKNDFVKWAEENDFVQTQLLDILSDDKNLIGSGFTHSTFAIPNNDDYVLRVGTSSLKYTLCKDNIGISELKASACNDDINVGQEVATITIPNEDAIPEEYSWKCTKVEVLKRQHGESIGVQPPETLVEGEYSFTTKAGVEPYEAMSRKEKYANTIHSVAELPVEAYEKLIETFQKAADSGYIFDYLNSNNLLVDTKEGAINLIDMDKNDGAIEPSYIDLLYALTNSQYYNTYTAEYAEFPIPEEQREQAKEDTITIISKFTEAMAKQGVKFDMKKVSYEAQRYLLCGLPMMYFCQSANPNAFWKKAEQMGILN